MSYKRSPVFSFVPTPLFDSPALPTRRRNHLRKRASTDTTKSTGLKLVDNWEQEKRKVFYKIFLRNADVASLQSGIVGPLRHTDELDAGYESVCVTVGSVDAHKTANCVVVIDVDVSPNKKWLNTGSDIYLHYLMQLRKTGNDIAEVSVESSQHVVDRLAAYNDYSLSRVSMAST